MPTRSTLPILLLLLGFTSSASAAQWFRLPLSSAPLFASPNSSSDEYGQISISSTAALNGKIYGRVYDSFLVPIAVTGVDVDHQISIAGLPGASFVPDGPSNGSGTLVWDAYDTSTWEAYASGIWDAVVEVRDTNGKVVHSAAFQFVIEDFLSVTVDRTHFVVQLGDQLTIVPQLQNSLGIVTWSAAPTPLPSWLNFDVATGTIKVDTSNINSATNLKLQAKDAADGMTATTLPFAISVVAPPGF